VVSVAELRQPSKIRIAFKTIAKAKKQPMVGILLLLVGMNRKEKQRAILIMNLRARILDNAIIKNLLRAILRQHEAMQAKKPATLEVKRVAKPAKKPVVTSRQRVVMNHLAVVHQTTIITAVVAVTVVHHQVAEAAVHRVAEAVEETRQ
jgi:hypothetical protein